MLKKLLLTVCLTAFMSWAQDDEDDDDFVSAPAKAAVAADEEDDDDFVSAPASRASIDTDSEDEDEDGFAGGASMTAAQRKEQADRKKFEEEQRQDEYANSLRRRDWLRNRLIFQMGMGSRYSFMGETGMGMSFGAGVEYILPFHLSLYGSFGLLPKGTDNSFDEWELEGGTGWKAGLTYYLFPKNPMHLGVSVSYGTVYFDHDIKPDADNVRALITVEGIQGDIIVSYMTNEWYYLQFSFGMYYAPKLAKTPDPEWAKEEDPESKNDNPSFRLNRSEDGFIDKAEPWLSKVENKKGMNKTGIVFGIAVGYALPELFPDDTEKRRRQREKERARSGR